MSEILRMETRHMADVRDASLFTNQSVVDVKDEVAGEATVVAMAVEVDAVVEAVVKVMGRKMTT